MKRNINKILWASAIVGLFVFSPLLSIQSSGEIRVKNTATENLNDQWAPIIGYIKIRGLPWNRSEIEIMRQDSDIYNWTGMEQNVRINWTIINTYDTSKTVWIGFRIRQWQSDTKIPRFLFLFTNSGCISTPQYKRWLNRQIIEIKPYTNSSGEFNITLNFINPPSYVDSSAFIWSYVPPPSGVRLNFAYSSQKVHFP